MNVNEKKGKDGETLLQIEFTGSEMDDKTWSIIVAIAKKEGKTEDQVLSDALKWAVSSGKMEEIAKKIKSGELSVQ